MITELKARAAKPREKPYMMRDSKGLYLRVDPSGKKYFILRYWENGKEHQKSLGPFPTVSLADAREQRNAIAAARRRGESPSSMPPASPPFGDLALEWQSVKLASASASYRKATGLRLRKYILQTFKDRPASQITPAEILALLRRIENCGHIDTARRVKMLMGQIFRFGIAAGMCVDDPTRSLTGALAPWKQLHYAASVDLLALAAAIRAYPWAIIRGVLLFQLLTASRPGEARRAEWNEISISGDTWTIPAEKMKMRRPHVVHLSKTASAVVEEMKQYNSAGRWLFPSARDASRPISDAAARVALRAMGFSKEEITPHGFRALFSTWANEHGANSDVIEACLAHQQRGVRAAYNHAQWKNERKELLQEWAEFLLKN